MNERTRLGVRSMSIVLIALALLLVAQGCKKEEPTAQPPSNPSLNDQVSAAGDEVSTAAQETAETAEVQVAAAIEQTTCPVMAGNPINKDLFVEYEGKKVYFCCKGCEDKFLADPAQYIAKLPQFQNQK